MFRKTKYIVLAILLAVGLSAYTSNKGIEEERLEGEASSTLLGFTFTVNPFLYKKTCKYSFSSIVAKSTSFRNNLSIFHNCIVEVSNTAIAKSSFFKIKKAHKTVIGLLCYKLNSYYFLTQNLTRCVSCICMNNRPCYI